MRILWCSLSCASAGIAAHAQATCLSGGSDANIQSALDSACAGGTPRLVELCSGAYFEIKNPIRVPCAHVKMTTAGAPTGDLRALLEITRSDVNGIIEAYGREGTEISHLRLDGNRDVFSYAVDATDARADSALITAGKARYVVIKHNELIETRGMSALTLHEGALSGCASGACTAECTQATVSNNTILKAGFGNGEWADGIRLACSNSTVTDNLITDATDGGIVVFGAPRSTISGNTISNVRRKSLGGINLVDYAPWYGDYRGVEVSGNTISASGAPIEVGLGVGPDVWFSAATEPNGGTQNQPLKVLNNYFEGGYFVYGLAAAEVEFTEIKGNSFAPGMTFVGTPSGSNPNPQDMVTTSADKSDSSNDFQFGFTWSAPVQRLIGAEPPLGTGSPESVADFLPTASEVSRYDQSGTLSYYPAMTNLSYYQGSCYLGRETSAFCMSAARRMCRSAGYETGFGSHDNNGERNDILCFTNAAAAEYSTTFSVLQGYHGGCTEGGSTVMSSACFAATKRFCNAQGHAGSVGIVEYYGSGAVVACATHDYSTLITITSFSDLTEHEPECNGGAALNSLACRRAVRAECRRRGYLTLAPPYYFHRNYKTGTAVQEYWQTGAAIMCVK